MKLIKTSLFLICFFLCHQIQAKVSPQGVILNNKAAELLKQALEKRKPENKEGILDGLLGKIMGTKKNDTAAAPTSPSTSQEETSPAEQNLGESANKGFTKGLSQQEKEKSELDTEAIHEAYKKSLEATLQEGESPEVRMNLALAFELNGELENAIKSYKMANKLAGTNTAVKFLSFYNLGRAHAGNKEVEKALQSYQAALDIYPESKEVKVNIELLLKNQQGGGGGGDDKKDNEDGKGKEPKPDAPMKENPKNSEYKSQNLSKKDVEKILEELKNQEQQIRAKEYGKGVKEKPRDKDW